MSGQLELRANDLPPKWDGCVVEWSDWSDGLNAFVCPPPRDRSVCPKCGSITARVEARGMVGLSPATTLERIANYRRFGKVGKVARYRLTAFRCVDCRHDQVFDSFGDLLWDLDVTDYGPDGSS